MSDIKNMCPFKGLYSNFFIIVVKSFKKEVGCKPSLLTCDVLDLKFGVRC